MATVETSWPGPGRLRWLPAADLLGPGEVACIDGRNAGLVVGAPGGHLGELLLLLSAWEAALGTPLADAAAAALAAAYLDGMGRFHLHTDAQAAAGVLAALGLPPDTDAEGLFTRPPPALRARLLDRLVRPEHQGCGHLKAQLAEPEAYATRRPLVETVLRTVFRRAWDGLAEVRVAVLEGEHAEQAVVSLEADPAATRARLVPAVEAPGPLNLFVVHPSARRFLQDRGAGLLRAAAAEQGLPAPDAAALARTLAETGRRQLTATLGRLAAHLPRFQVVAALPAARDMSQHAAPAMRHSASSSAQAAAITPDSGPGTPGTTRAPGRVEPRPRRDAVHGGSRS